MALETREFVVGFISSIIGIVIGVLMIPVLTNALETANLSGPVKAVADIIPIAVIAGLVIRALHIL